jgi:hypothetical protein
MSSTAVQGRTDRGIHRRVEHIMGMPISLAMRGRHASSDAADQAWEAVITREIRPALRLELTFVSYWPLQPEVWCSPQGSRSVGAPRHHLCTRRPPRQLRGVASLRLQS